MLRLSRLIRPRIPLAAVIAVILTAHAAHAQGDGVRPRFALIVGIKSYKSREIPPTPGSDADARLMREVLVSGFGFPDDSAHMRVLETEQATRERIVSEFKNFLIKSARENAAKKPIIVFYFSGHGTRYENQKTDVQDSDASDGWDEAIVPYDSRDAGVFDILDDELDDLSAELSQAAPDADILFIFDSCHSGTVTRADGSARETPGDPRGDSRPVYRRRFSPSDVEQLTKRNIVTLAAALPHEKAYPKTDLSNGVMTSNLAAALRRATKDTTYAELMRDVRSAVQSAGGSSQTPFAEGDEFKPVLGESSLRSDASFAIVAGPTDGKIKINAGAMHGVRPGSLVAVYEQSARRLKGGEGFQSYASIESVGDRESVAVLPAVEANPKVKGVDGSSKVVLASPTFGGEPITLVFDDASMASVSSGDVAKKVDALVQDPENPLKRGGMLSVSTLRDLRAKPLNKRPANVFLLKKGKFGAVFPDTSVLKLPSSCPSDNSFFPTPDTEVYYLQSGISAASPRPQPVFGRYFVATDPDVAEEIAQSLTVFARQQLMLNLENVASTLNDRIDIELKPLPIFLAATCPLAGKGKVLSGWSCKGTLPQSTRSDRLRQDQVYEISVKNLSAGPYADEALYVAVFLVSTDGRMELLNAGSLRDKLTTTKPLTRRLRSSQPAGGETLKVIVTRNVSDLESLRMMEQGEWQKTRSAFESPLAKLLTRSGTRSAGETALSPSNPDSWGVRTLQWTVSTAKFSCENGGPIKF